MFKRKSKEEKTREQIRNALTKIAKNINDSKDYSKQKQKILDLSTPSNKEELMEDYLKKILIFIDYGENFEEFPFDSWVDSFFEN